MSTRSATRYFFQVSSGPGSPIRSSSFVVRFE